MALLKAVVGGRWRIAPRTSLDVEEGQTYDVPPDVAAYLIDAGLAVDHDDEAKAKAAPPAPEAKVVTDYEKPAAPRAQNKNHRRR